VIPCLNSILRTQGQTVQGSAIRQPTLRCLKKRDKILREEEIRVSGSAQELLKVFDSLPASVQAEVAAAIMHRTAPCDLLRERESPEVLDLKPQRELAVGDDGSGEPQLPTFSNAQLRALAKASPPPPEWLEGDETMPF
jgi:hypothetical protein